MRAALTLLLFLAAMLPGAVAHASTDARAWFDNEGEATLQSFAPTTFPDLSEEERAQLTIGVPVPFATIDEIATNLSGEGEPTNFIAPVSLDGTVVGVISHSVDEATEETDRVVADARLGEMMMAMEDGDRLFYDTVLDGHFIRRGNQIIPASEAALDRLAGSTSVDMFFGLRAEIMTEGPVTAVQPNQPESTPVLLVTILLALFLFFTLVLTWLRRSPVEPLPSTPVRKHFREVRFYRRGGTRVHTDD